MKMKNTFCGQITTKDNHENAFLKKSRVNMKMSTSTFRNGCMFLALMKQNAPEY